MTLFPTIEHPFLNVIESNNSDCECIIDSSSGLVLEKLSLNILSHILLLFIHIKSRKWSHNFASLNREFSLLPSPGAQTRADGLMIIQIGSSICS